MKLELNINGVIKEIASHGYADSAAIQKMQTAAILLGNWGT